MKADRPANILWFDLETPASDLRHAIFAARGHTRLLELALLGVTKWEQDVGTPGTDEIEAFELGLIQELAGAARHFADAAWAQYVATPEPVAEARTTAASTKVHSIRRRPSETKEGA